MNPNLEIKSRRIVQTCQQKKTRIVQLMENTSFGERLKRAFGGAKQVEIARKMGVSESAVKNYVAGRVPDVHKLQLISNLTNCSLHWLLTGEGPQFATQVTGGAVPLSKGIYATLRRIANEQAHIVYGDAEIAGSNVDDQTLELLTEFLLVNALERFNLLTLSSVMHTADKKRAERFTFASNEQSTLDDRIRELVSEEITRRRQEMLPDEVGPIEPARFMSARHMGTANAEEELPSSNRKRKTK